MTNSKTDKDYNQLFEKYKEVRQRIDEIDADRNEKLTHIETLTEVITNLNYITGLTDQNTLEDLLSQVKKDREELIVLRGTYARFTDSLGLSQNNSPDEALNDLSAYKAGYNNFVLMDGKIRSFNHHLGFPPETSLDELLEKVKTDKNRLNDLENFYAPLIAMLKLDKESTPYDVLQKLTERLTQKTIPISPINDVVTRLENVVNIVKAQKQKTVASQEDIPSNYQDKLPLKPLKRYLPTIGRYLAGGLVGAALSAALVFGLLNSTLMTKEDYLGKLKNNTSYRSQASIRQKAKYEKLPKDITTADKPAPTGKKPAIPPKISFDCPTKKILESKIKDAKCKLIIKNYNGNDLPACKVYCSNNIKPKIEFVPTKSYLLPIKTCYNKIEKEINLKVQCSDKEGNRLELIEKIIEIQLPAVKKLPKVRPKKIVKKPVLPKIEVTQSDTTLDEPEASPKSAASSSPTYKEPIKTPPKNDIPTSDPACGKGSLKQYECRKIIDSTNPEGCINEHRQCGTGLSCCPPKKTDGGKIGEVKITDGGK